MCPENQEACQEHTGTTLANIMRRATTALRAGPTAGAGLLTSFDKFLFEGI